MAIQLRIADCGLRIQRRLRGCHNRRAHGVALLEVVLALAVFFGVAVTILGGLSVCMRSTTQVREEAQAADLAVTVLSYVQMGVLEAADAGPTPFEDPYADWTWQTAATVVEASVAGLEMTQLEITVRNTLDGYVFRLYELVPNEEDVTSTQPSDSSESSSSGQSSGDRSGRGAAAGSGGGT